jgi:hypothetical protein
LLSPTVPSPNRHRRSRFLSWERWSLPEPENFNSCHRVPHLCTLLQNLQLEHNECLRIYAYTRVLNWRYSKLWPAMNEPTEFYSSMITYGQRSKPNMTLAAIYCMVSHLQSSGFSSQLFHPSPETIECGWCDGGIVAIMLHVSPDKMHRTAHVIIVHLTYPDNCVSRPHTTL